MPSPRSSDGSPGRSRRWLPRVQWHIWLSCPGACPGDAPGARQRLRQWLHCDYGGGLWHGAACDWQPRGAVARETCIRTMYAAAPRRDARHRTHATAVPPRN
ncbi:hypothetical protein WOLCODRAFT_28598 [Wolfiporia cocos MD-104 SS10]|uniref:Uncharacterized protein n=1 Tax=Wolfiporia cocos (strain MD-104) TaxID=742152 RepID=A0A2H3JCJ2_WOLCO|nr:hypothetical protein WOLCODRAFT_28598 [Wolfiporia cocos MD-104 SS10]